MQVGDHHLRRVQGEAGGGRQAIPHRLPENVVLTFFLGFQDE